ncbi:hypothetical protein AQUCO_02800247v1 [Aquilegia coerulea]|uniref:Protein yippee-like n=2 Tax=Aquilegia coerulea TaxID=218851 RepID=A0A2G5D5C0_AQUCA|nr:hypothetical protein AQUCO_02800247v1 [Aquilegia coerulea]
MGRLFIESISSTMVYKCKCCRVDLTSSGQIIDKNFQSKSGKAYLFNKVVNITLGSCEDRSFVTGLHTVSDIHCSSCHQLLGWKYVSEGLCGQSEIQRREVHS